MWRIEWKKIAFHRAGEVWKGEENFYWLGNLLLWKVGNDVDDDDEE